MILDWLLFCVEGHFSRIEYALPGDTPEQRVVIETYQDITLQVEDEGLGAFFA